MNDFNSGTQFDFSYAPGTSAEQILGFEMAGEVWSSLLTDNVKVRIHVESTSDLPDEVIGAALPGKKQKEEYKDIYEALTRDTVISDNDDVAIKNLPSKDKDEDKGKFDKFNISVGGEELGEAKDFRLTNANAKSLGLLKDKGDKLDGYILINDLSGNSSVGWDYDALRSGGASGNDMDFLSVAMHEIGHVLGFVSGIDDNDWLEVLAESVEDDKEIKGDDFKFASILDLYRYSDSTSPLGEIDLSVGGNPYFSIDGGSTNLGNFANGEYTQLGGDGYQASHWKQDTNQGIMNPILPQGQRRDISDLDLTAFDVIGWDINTAAAPSWDELYDNAVAGAETANIRERDKDIEKLIKESGYDLGRSRRTRRSSRSSFRNYSYQLGEWQFTTMNAVESPEAIEAVIPDAPIVATEPDTAESDNIGQGESESEITVSNDPVAINTPEVDTEPNITVDSNEENISQTEEEIIENNNVEFVNNNGITINEPLIESELDLAVDNNLEVAPSIAAKPKVAVATQNNVEFVNNSGITINEPLIESELDIAIDNNLEVAPSIAANPKVAVATQNNVEFVNNNGITIDEPLIESELDIAIDNNFEVAPSTTVEPEAIAETQNSIQPTENVYWYVPGYGYYLAPSITGVSDSGQDSLFYVNNR